jgi:hypothetical protein
MDLSSLDLAAENERLRTDLRRAHIQFAAAKDRSSVAVAAASTGP